MTNKITITEALAETKLIQNKVNSKFQYIGDNLLRPASRIDPLADEGGSEKIVNQELQAVDDLYKRLIAIRKAIRKANEETILDVEGMRMSLADWLTWRREVLPTRKQILREYQVGIHNTRQKIGQPQRLQAAQTFTGEDLIVHVNEKELQEEIERYQTIEDRLDGLLSLKNAQTEIEV